MRKLTLFLLLLPLAAGAQQRVRDLDITVSLERDGTAVVSERWDLSTGNNITEWYLVRSNLSDMRIDGFRVLDGETALADDGEWNVDRSMAQKAGKYGIVHKYDGVELCWGIGSYGDHVFTAIYNMHGAVKAAEDYDFFHIQLVSPGMAAAPEHVRVTLETSLAQLDTTVARAWGFGYVGTCLFQEGKVVMEGYDMDTEDSVISLLRFDKGIFEPLSIRETDFQTVLDRAMEGADFGTDEEEEDDTAAGVMGLITIIIGWILYRRWKKLNKKVMPSCQELLGVKAKDIPWYRDIPMDGDLSSAKCMLEIMGENTNDSGPLASALILRMIYSKYLDVSREAENKPTEIRFTERDHSGLDKLSRGLYDMLLAAAGENKVLERNEFLKWSRKHHLWAEKWAEDARQTGRDHLKQKGFNSGSTANLTAKGKQEGVRLLGLRKFLKEFTLTKEREAFDAHLWKEYLVFGALLGVAENVAKQLKEIAPEYGSVETVLSTSQSFSHVVSLAATLVSESRKSYASSSSGSSYSSHSSHSGYGGHSSRSGGGGYSGGGRGGGGR